VTSTSERFDHRSRILVVPRLAQYDTVAFADRVRRKDPCSRRTACSAPRSNPTGFEVGECGSNLTGFNITKHKRTIVEVRGLYLDLKARVPQHGDPPRRTTRKDKGRRGNGRRTVGPIGT
jgi:hypothetical protein